MAAKNSKTSSKKSSTTTAKTKGTKKSEPVQAPVVEEADAEKILYDIETDKYCPVPIEDGKYECPNCGEIVVEGQERCIDETCDLEFVWR